MTYEKSILSFGGTMMVLLLVFSCTEEQENINLPDEGVNLKGEVNNAKQEGDERGTYDVAQLLTYLHGYIKAEASEDYKYYGTIPERKEVHWFFENFETEFRSGSEADNWVLDNINAGEIFIFGTTVKDAKVAALIFSEDLDLPARFKDSRGFFLDTNRKDCDDIYVRYGFTPETVVLVIGQNLVTEGLYDLSQRGANLDLEHLFDFDQWIINEHVLVKYGSVPVSEINIGDPVLQLERK